MNIQSNNCIINSDNDIIVAHSNSTSRIRKQLIQEQILKAQARPDFVSYELHPLKNSSNSLVAFGRKCSPATFSFGSRDVIFLCCNQKLWGQRSADGWAYKADSTLRVTSSCPISWIKRASLLSHNLPLPSVLRGLKITVKNFIMR